MVTGGQYKPLIDDRIGRIHETSLRVLDEIGVEVKHPEALELFEKGGASVDGEKSLVRMPSRIVETCIQSAPSCITLCGREEAHDMQLEHLRVHMGTGGAALNVIDPETNNKRPGTLQDIARFARLADGLENIDFFIRPCTAQDVALEILGINEFYAAVTNTSKHVMGTGYTLEGTRDVIRMAEMISGSAEKLRERPFISFTAGCLKSPLTFDPEMIDMLRFIVEKGIPVALSSAPMAGATAPVTMAGTLTLLHAEELAGIVFTQLVNPGAPVLYGGIPGMADMHDLSYRAGGVEFGLMNAAISQLSDYIHIPNYCSAGITEANIPGMQAIYEKTFSICQCALAGSNYIHHAAGVLESILTVEYGQFVIDNEIIGMAMKMIQGIEVDEDRMAFEEIRAAGPGGDFLSLEHTMRYMRSEFIEPMLVPREKRPVAESLYEHKPLSVLAHARAKAQKIIADHGVKQLPDAIDTAIRDTFDIVLSGQIH